jgi:hypothetical protein
LARTPVSSIPVRTGPTSRRCRPNSRLAAGRGGDKFRGFGGGSRLSISSIPHAPLITGSRTSPRIRVLKLNFRGISLGATTVERSLWISACDHRHTIEECRNSG